MEFGVRFLAVGIQGLIIRTVYISNCRQVQDALDFVQQEWADCHVLRTTQVHEARFDVIDPRQQALPAPDVQGSTTNG